MIRVTNSLNLDCSKSIENLNKFQTISAYWNSSLIKIFADIVEMKYFKNRKVHLCFILDKSEMFFLGGWSYFSLRIFHDPDRRALQDLTLFYNLTAVVYLGSGYSEKWAAIFCLTGTFSSHSVLCDTVARRNTAPHFQYLENKSHSTYLQFQYKKGKSFHCQLLSLFYCEVYLWIYKRMSS